MNILEEKEKNLYKLIDKLNALTSTYSQSTYQTDNILSEKSKILKQKQEIEKKNQELIRENKYLKNKIKNLKKDLKKKINLENEFNQEIEEISQETQNLYEEVDKWRT